MPSRRGGGDVAKELDKLKYDALISKTELEQFSSYLKERHDEVDKAIEAQTLGYYMNEKAKGNPRLATGRSHVGSTAKQRASKIGTETVEREL